jgi:hypothetical protein
MNKILIIIAFFIASNVYANANWQPVTESVTPRDAFLVDRDSFQKSGDSITFWELRNYANRHKNGVLSLKLQRTINCRTREVIDRWYMSYDDINGNGKLTSNFQATDKWTPIPPETVNWYIFSYVCK